MNSLSIKNFQSIEHLEFSWEKPSFIVVEGKTDAGKSAFNRSLMTLFHNSWDKGFIRNGEKETEIELSLNGNKITQTKSSTKNSYVINKKSYDKIGIDVPEEFKGLGIKTFKVDSDHEYDIIFSPQLDPLFFVTFKDTINTKILNKIFNTEIYEVALSAVNRDIYNLKVGLTNKQKEYDAKKVELLTVGKIETILDSISTTTNNISLANSFVDTVVNLGGYRQKEKEISGKLGLFREIKRFEDSLVTYKQHITSKGFLEDKRVFSSNLEVILSKLKETSLLYSSKTSIVNFISLGGLVSKAKQTKKEVSKTLKACTLCYEGFLELSKHLTLIREFMFISDVLKEKSDKSVALDTRVNLLSTLYENGATVSLYGMLLSSKEAMAMNRNKQSLLVELKRLLEVKEVVLKTKSASVQKKQLKNRLDSMVSELGVLHKSLPDICPTCGKSR